MSRTSPDGDLGPQVDLPGLRERLVAGEMMLNGWLSLSDPFVAELVTSQGWDCVTVDRQHGRRGPGTLWELALAISSHGGIPGIRIPSLAHSDLPEALDAGFELVICPQIETSEEAESLARACRYPPKGVRSYGPTRAGLGFQGDFMSESDKRIVCLAMIESQRALNNLPEILMTEGLDGIYVGPVDLAISLGTSQPQLDDDRLESLDRLRKIADSAREAGRVAGLHCGSAGFAAFAHTDLGFNLVTVGSDVRFIREAGLDVVQDLRDRSVPSMSETDPDPIREVDRPTT